MENEYVKKLTGKNPKDFEFAAFHIVNTPDLEAFKALVEKSEFLFDFIKQNVSKRLSNAVNEKNYQNILTFLPAYSPDYEDFIVTSLVKFANEDLTDEMLELLSNGTDEQKTYAAKYFVRINDTLALDELKKNAFSQFPPLATNCAQALSAMNDRESYDLALKKFDCEDEFEKISAINFLISYGDKNTIGAIFSAMKKSPMPENIAAEIPYLIPFSELLETNRENTLLALNHILNGLGEIVAISQIFDFQLFEIFEKLINEATDSKSALLLLLAKLKFEQITENDEYLFDEDKNTKQEVFEVKNLLNSQPEAFYVALKKQFQAELNDKSEFVFSALQIVQELDLNEAFENLKPLLDSENQTIILKTVEVIKSLNLLKELDKNIVLSKISDSNIKAIIESLFN